MSKLFSKRSARIQWDAGLAWFRLRYLTPAGVTKAIRLLSRPVACERVALVYRPGGAVSELYLGVPAPHVRLLKRMAGDFGFMLRPPPEDLGLPEAQRLAPAADLPWERPFVAHVVNEHLFVSALYKEERAKNGHYMPGPQTGEPPGWQFPADPPSGLTTKPCWEGYDAPEELIAREPDLAKWPLGRSLAGEPLHVGGRINVYGRQESVADWLGHLVTRVISLDPSNLIVIDGAGDLVPRLKRRAAVTKLLGEQLTYVDIDSASMIGGFNPLAAVPGEGEAALLARWQRWFEGMHVHPQGVALLEEAYAAGVRDIPALRKWLRQSERQGKSAAAAGLNLALNRLTANRTLREWLEWPTNPFEVLPDGALLFSCQGSSWERRQLLRMVMLGTAAGAGARVVVNGLEGKEPLKSLIFSQNCLVIGNGPELPASTVVLTESQGNKIDELARGYLGDDPKLTENLSLLNWGEGIGAAAERIFFASG